MWIHINGHIIDPAATDITAKRTEYNEQTDGIMPLRIADIA